MHIRKMKPHSGKLSPGCRICMKGTWACIFLTMRCTRSCFFCPQDKQKLYSEKPNLDGIFFDSPEDSVAFLKKYRFEGVGLSGGEPFLVFETLLSYISTIRREPGKQMYIWAYTNGDLVTKERAKQLAKAGLNELRFDIAARGYNFDPLLIAKKYLPTVTIETPIIPEDKKLLSVALQKAKKYQISFINLHELYRTPHNQ
ncbi:MAG: radical SAM protein, partial [bacterium]